MTNCIFISHNGPKKYICKVCGFQTNYKNLIKNCRKPSITQQAKNLTKAAAKHISTGLKHCTKEQRDSRYEICKKCDRFHNGICNHDDCGCIIRSKGKFMDKLSWADSKCPEGYWGPISKKDT